jgi:REP element-mobilizing transposase RayT
MLVHAVWSQFARTAEVNCFDVPAYCFMPDHLHLLAEGIRAKADLRVFVAEAKRLAAHAARRSPGAAAQVSVRWREQSYAKYL